MLNPLKIAQAAKYANDCLVEVNLIAQTLNETLLNLDMPTSSKLTIQGYVFQIGEVTKKYVELTAPILKEVQQNHD